MQGVTQALGRDAHTLGGFELAIVSDVPLGSGLSSSASLEVAVLRALRALFGLALDDVTTRGSGQRAENDFVGAPVGVMDQMAASLADDHTALFLDTRTLQYEQVRVAGRWHRRDQLWRGAQPRERRLPHQAGGMRAGGRRAPRAAAAQSRAGQSAARGLTAGAIARRARHVITEDERVLESVAAMKAGNLGGLASCSRRRTPRSATISRCRTRNQSARRFGQPRIRGLRRPTHRRRVRRMNRRPRRCRRGSRGRITCVAHLRRAFRQSSECSCHSPADAHPAHPDTLPGTMLSGGVANAPLWRFRVPGSRFQVGFRVHVPRWVPVPDRANRGPHPERGPGPNPDLAHRTRDHVEPGTQRALEPGTQPGTLEPGTRNRTPQVPSLHHRNRPLVVPLRRAIAEHRQPGRRP